MKLDIEDRKDFNIIVDRVFDMLRKGANFVIADCGHIIKRGGNFNFVELKSGIFVLACDECKEFIASDGGDA